MGKIVLEEMEVYAFHGLMKEETKIGSLYRINLELDVDFEKAIVTDSIEDTFNYHQAYLIIEEEMKKPSSLLENIAGRILKRLSQTSSIVKAAKIKLSKMNPPFGGDVKAVSVVIEEKFNR